MPEWERKCKYHLMTKAIEYVDGTMNESTDRCSYNHYVYISKIPYCVFNILHEFLFYIITEGIRSLFTFMMTSTLCCNNFICTIVYSLMS